MKGPRRAWKHLKKQVISLGRRVSAAVITAQDRVAIGVSSVLDAARNQVSRHVNARQEPSITFSSTNPFKHMAEEQLSSKNIQLTDARNPFLDDIMYETRVTSTDGVRVHFNPFYEESENDKGSQVEPPIPAPRKSKMTLKLETIAPLKETPENNGGNQKIEPPIPPPRKKRMPKVEAPQELEWEFEEPSNYWPFQRSLTSAEDVFGINALELQPFPAPQEIQNQNKSTAALMNPETYGHTKAHNFNNPSTSKNFFGG